MLLRGVSAIRAAGASSWGITSLGLAIVALTALGAEVRDHPNPAPLQIARQGSFGVGGTVEQASGTFDPRRPLEPSGQTYRGDHLYAFYQVPVWARKYPIIMWQWGRTIL